MKCDDVAKCAACAEGIEPGTLAHSFLAPECHARKGRGGPRPGFGGKQPGAGRPVKPVGDKPVAIIVDPDTARKIDALRGDMSRAEYLRRLVDAPYCEQH